MVSPCDSATDGKVADIKIGLGGVAATPLRATATEEFLTGRPWTPRRRAGGAAVLNDEGTPISDHRASAAYRTAMLGASLRKFHAENPAAANQEVGHVMSESHGTAGRPADQPKVGLEIPHESADLHVTGKALYTDDLVARTRTRCTPGRCRRRTRTRMITRAECRPRIPGAGVVRVLTAEDVPGVNDAGIKHDEPLFPTR